MSPAPREPTRLIRGLLRLYPALWRARFGDEFAAVLAASFAGGHGRRRPWIALDVLVGAADAHSHRSFEPGRQPMPDRVRASAQVAFFAFAVFCLAGTGFQKMTEDLRFRSVAQNHAAIGFSYDVILYGAIGAAGCVAAGSLPVLRAIVKQALADGGVLRRLLVIPPISVLAWLALVFAVTRLEGSARHSAINIAAFVVIVIAFCLVAAVSAGALIAATQRADLPARVKRSQWLSMIGLSVAMVAVSVADLVWGLSLRSQAPGVFHSDNGLLATSMPATWLSTLAVMALASAAAVAATTRAITAVRAERRLI